MSKGANHNSGAVEAPVSAAGSRAYAGDAPATIRRHVRHIYVHIPFCARICPYCAFYKDLLDRSQTSRFCEALLRELELNESPRRTGDRRSLLRPFTIYFGGGTPTALNIAQLELLLRGFHERLELSQLVEWTIEANPGSVSARKAALLQKFGVNRISLGVQSWDDELLRLLGREHNAQQAEESFRILRDAGFTNVNVDLMFGLPGQTVDQWRATLEKTIALEPEHVSTYCLTYEEDTEFFLRNARGEFRQDSDVDGEFFEMTMAMLEDADYQHYEISNYARPGFESVHNRAYWLGKDYLGIGPSAVSTIGMQRWQNVCDYRAYIDRVLSGESTRTTSENLTHEMKRTERIALGLRTRDGISASELKDFAQETDELIGLELLRKSNGNFVLTRRGKSLADSITEAFL
ncbi:MAG: radical SAM family heme chaperone HemW [Candidatus Udaeobacter sp.]